MDRFFSKLDLRDIKIDPFNASFPPDAEEPPAAEEAEPPPSPPAAEAARPRPDRPAPQAVATTPNGWGARPRHVPAWAAAAPADAGPLAAAPARNGSLRPHEAPGGLAPAATALADAALANGHAVAHAPAATLDPDPDPDPAGGDVLKVSARSRPSAVAGAIAGVVRESGRAEVQAIGAGATNQAIKAVAIARDYLRETGIEAVCLPAFIDVTIDNEDRTAIRLVIEPR